MNIIFENIIEKKIRDLLEKISYNYPTQFKHEYINTEIEYIKKHIILKPYVKKISIVPSTTVLDAVVTSTDTSTNTSIDNICSGRVWHNYILDRKTMTKVKEISEIFKVNNFKDIKINKFNSKYILGLRCKKIKYKESKYCKLHTSHLIHGDYKELPSKEMCYHFIKDGKYL